ncbi:MAG TPA: HAD family hydrolase [Chloroflexota bacterium]|nr:HAD family hydrolase [Chloroflexota bacterium]
MLEIDIPGWKCLHLEHLVLDVNGTVALDGSLLPGVIDRIGLIRGLLEPHLLSGDTYGQLEVVAAQLQANAVRISADGSAPERKAAFIRGLGTKSVVAVGNGANDAAMLQEAALGIGILGGEGLAVGALQVADIVVPSILDGLDLLANPLRLVASLRR